MLIDIDIKIADENGKLIHRFEKSFDDRSVYTMQNEYISDLGKSFEDFLSEYMSISGRMIRERLISEYNYSIVHPYHSENFEKKEFATEFEGTEDFENTEMEYKIRIGNKKIVTGKIPFNHNNSTLLKSDQLNNNYYLTDELQEDQTKASIKRKTKHKHPSYQMNWQQDGPANRFTCHKLQPIKHEQNRSDLDAILSFAMTKAIEKYELNLSPIIDESNLVLIEP